MRGLFCLLLLPMTATAQEGDLKPFLAKPILPPRHTLTQTQKFLESRLPPLPRAATRADWETQVARLRKDMFEKVVYRGEAARWREAKRNVVWGEVLPAEGYQIKKLRYEALPGLWIPAVLYEPTKLE